MRIGTKKNPIVVNVACFYKADGFWFCNDCGKVNMVFSTPLCDKLNEMKKQFGSINAHEINFLEYAKKLGQ